MAVDLKSPLALRINAWFMERFPPANWLMFIVIYLSCSLFGQAIGGSEIITIGMREVLGALVSIAFFLLIRILDEHKDYADDLVFHPERVLQRGLVSLNQLKVIGALCFVLVLGFSIYCDQGFGPTTVAFFVVFLWLSLMTKEFFCKEWLKPRLVLYAVSHMLIMPLVVIWFLLSAMATPDFSPLVLWLAFGSFFFGFAFEMTRKTKGVEEEIAGVDTYSSLLGRNKSSFMSILMVVLGLLCQSVIAMSIGQQSVIFYLVMYFVLAVVVITGFMAYLKNPDAKSRKRNEALVGLSSLSSYIALMVLLIQQYGFALTLF